MSIKIGTRVRYSKYLNSTGTVVSVSTQKTTEGLEVLYGVDWDESADKTPCHTRGRDEYGQVVLGVPAEDIV